MKNYLFIPIVFFILSCSEKKKVTENITSKDLTESQIDSVLSSFKFQYETPIVIDSLNQTIIPISTELFERRKTFSSGGYYSDNFPRYWNFLFINDNQSHLLSEQKMRISNFYLKPNEYNNESKSLKGNILYTINNIDYNEDRKLDFNDPEGLFCSDLDGSNFRRISPKLENLKYFEVLNSTTIIYQTLQDTKLDSVFAIDEDRLVWYKSKLKNGQWSSEVIVSNADEKKIEQLYFEKWLRKYD